MTEVLFEKLVHELGYDRPDGLLNDLAPVTLNRPAPQKNIPRPVQVYEVEWSPRAATAARWQHRINSHLDGQFEILAQIRRQPTIHPGGRRISSLAEAARARDAAKVLKREHRDNNPHGLLIGDPIWQSDPLNLSIETCDFATVRAIRSAGERPAVLSANNVLVCPELDQIIVNKRSADVDQFPLLLHTFGGAYLPPEHANADRAGLSATAHRKTMQQSQIAISLDNAAIIAAREIETGFIQIVYLGATTGPSQFENSSGNEEAREIVRVGFEKLEEFLVRTDWCPSGKGHVLAWLALGAPNAPSGAIFCGLSPIELFDRLVP